MFIVLKSRGIIVFGCPLYQLNNAVNRIICFSVLLGCVIIWNVRAMPKTLTLEMYRNFSITWSTIVRIYTAWWGKWTSPCIFDSLMTCERHMAHHRFCGPCRHNAQKERRTPYILYICTLYTYVRNPRLFLARNLFMFALQWNIWVEPNIRAVSSHQKRNWLCIRWLAQNQCR